MKKLKSLLYLCCLSIIMASCGDELDLSPTDALPTDEALNDISGARAAILGLYNGLQSVSYYGRNYLVMPEVEGDLVYLSIANSNRFVTNYTYTWNADNTDIRDLWNVAYSTIFRANNIIARIDNIEGDETELNSIKGEALGLRALIYFDLVRAFAKPYTQSTPTTDLGVPLVLTPGVEEPARNTIEEVYTQIIADLNAARPLLTNESIYRFSQDAADALLARVYLYKGDYANAEQAASTVINSGRYAIAEDIVAAFAEPGSSEEIFTLRYVATETNGADNLGQIYNPEGYGDIRVSEDLIDLYEEGDDRLEFIYEEPTSGEFFQSKFFAQDDVPGLFSPKILRISEMYLIRAEANARQNKGTQALADLNAIRTKRGATSLSGLSGDALLQAVLDERRRELAFEGHTKFDLWRNGIDLVRDQCNTGVELTAPCTIEATSNLIVYPIPRREVDVNQNIVQNPGY
ncbi:MAG: RagB/SusD family nutrient uptake outer membrane protein [Saprospiraceae bacterium]